MRKLTFTILFCLVAFIATNLNAITYNAVVAKDGTGNYTSVQAAFNAAPTNSSTRWIIYIKNGTYTEMLNLIKTKTNITIIGQSRDAVILTYNNYATKINPLTGAAYGTSGSASTYIHGAGFYAMDVTFRNSAGAVGQALAVYADGDKCVFKNCKFIGNQDTFYGGACRQFFHDCYFEGTTDFIFGPSIAVFETCKLHSKGGTAFTAASTESYVPYGYVFIGCTIQGNSGVATDLGRPWRPYASVSFLNCTMSSVVNARGWNDWGNAANQATARFGEYGNTGAGSSMTGRPAWIKRITAAQAANYTILNVLKGTYANPQIIDNWNPNTVISATKSAKIENIKSLSEASKLADLTIYPNPVVDGNLNFKFNAIDANENITVSISNIQGKMVFTENYIGKQLINLNKNLTRGTYIVNVKGSKTSIVKKIIVK